MIKRSFFGLIKPRLAYEMLEDNPPTPESVLKPGSVTLFLKKESAEKTGAIGRIPSLKVGDKVQTGQKLTLHADDENYAVATITGTVSAISNFIGDFRQEFTAVTLKADDGPETMDETFAAFKGNPTPESARDFLHAIPGGLPSNLVTKTDKSVNTIIVYGVDRDILLTTSQYFLRTQMGALKSGATILRQITGINKIVLIVPTGMTHKAFDTGMEVKAVKMTYPEAFPQLVIKEILGQELIYGQSLADAGICCLSSETLVSLAKAYGEGRIPHTKLITLIKKDGTQSMVTARIGTPVKDIFKAQNIYANENDRLIVGGPLTGYAIYSEQYPVMPDMDALMIQDKDELPEISDTACVNCGECIRMCPARVPVNLLVRLLEAGQYEEAAEQYDLHACIECGLCAYVCNSRIPIFQYIKLAKFELEQMVSENAEAAEANDAESK